VEADLDELDRLIDSGRVEVALAYHVRAGVHTIFERIAELPPYAVLPARHRLAQRKWGSVKDLAAEPFILVDLPYSRDFLLSVFRSGLFQQLPRERLPTASEPTSAQARTDLERT
jgi:DNA-binding transcriptional LysR family regulator